MDPNAYPSKNPVAAQGNRGCCGIVLWRPAEFPTRIGNWPPFSRIEPYHHEPPVEVAGQGVSAFHRSRTKAGFAHKEPAPSRAPQTTTPATGTDTPGKHTPTFGITSTGAFCGASWGGSGCHRISLPAASWHGDSLAFVVASWRLNNQAKNPTESTFGVVASEITRNPLPVSPLSLSFSSRFRRKI